MNRSFWLCLALSSCLLAAGKPKAGPASLKANPDVPAAGGSAELVVGGRGRALVGFPASLTDFQATTMADGRVLITGGSLTGAGSLWYDPGKRAFSPGPVMAQPRQGHQALLLKDGRLLLVGGTEAATLPELLEPGAARFQPLACAARFGLSAGAVELDGGKVLLVDGASGQCATWDGKSAFRNQGTLNRPRYCFGLTRLKDGKALITGGWPAEQRRKGRAPQSNPPNLPVECFNPRWNSLSSWRALPQPRARHQATLLEDGRVCLWAGYGADANSVCEAVELLDPAKETVTPAGTLALEGKASPGWSGQLFLGEGRQALRPVADPLALLVPGAPGARLANAYLAPTLVPLPNDQVLILGTPAWGVPLDRWDVRTHQCAVVGSMRAGVQTVGLTPDGKVLTLGPVVDLLDPRSGALTPLGWREELSGLLATLQLDHPGPMPVPPFAPGEARKDYLVVALDKSHALVVGGSAEGSAEATGKVDLWDQRKKTLSPMGPMKTRRVFPAGTGTAQGALKLKDGSVLIWGAGDL